VRTKLERSVEQDVLQYCRELGIICCKLKLASESGWPDRSLFYRGHAMFLELKRKGERPTPLQLYTLDVLEKAGFDARWSDDLEQMKLIILGWKRHVDISRTP
jgi:hypothetical protein